LLILPGIFVQLKRFTTYRHVPVSGNGALFNRTDLVVDPDVVDFLGLLGLAIGGQNNSLAAKYATFFVVICLLKDLSKEHLFLLISLNILVQFQGFYRTWIVCGG